tara:strand:+ start:1464 stop:1682 length:219 start_codon:yes stop_codon:yes gene_type:complete
MAKTNTYPLTFSPIRLSSNWGKEIPMLQDKQYLDSTKYYSMRISQKDNMATTYAKALQKEDTKRALALLDSL